MTEVVVCSAAEIDYLESLTCYAEQSVIAANDFDADFDRALTQIASDPIRFPFADARHRYFVLRRFPFRIIYRILGENVVVIAVAHNSRSPDYWAGR